MSCGCNSKKIPKTQPASLLSGSGNFSMEGAASGEDITTQLVNVEFMGPEEQSFTIRSRVDRRVAYRFGNNPHHKEATVYLQDAEFLISMTDGDGRPKYRILNVTSPLEERNVAEFLGMQTVE